MPQNIQRIKSALNASCNSCDCNTAGSYATIFPKFLVSGFFPHPWTRLLLAATV